MTLTPRVQENKPMPARGKASPERTCVLTGETKQSDHLIRFVESPEGILVPDVAHKLPGRGVWITADKVLIDSTLEDKRFTRAMARALKRQITGEQIPLDLSALIEKLLSKRLLNRLGLEKAAGRIVTGYDKAKGALKNQKPPVAMLWQARDASEDGRSRLSEIARAVGVKEVGIFDREELSMALGRDNVVHAVLLKGGVLDQIEADLIRLGGFRS